MFADIVLHQLGQQIGFEIRSVYARETINENIVTEPWMWLGNVLWVDHRAADDVLEIVSTFGMEIA